MGGGFSHQQISYNVPVEGTKQKGFSQIYRNPKSLKGPQKTFEPSITNMKDVIYRAVKNYKDKDFVGKITIKTIKEGQNTREERQLTKFKYGEILNMSEKVGSYLINNKMDYHQKLHNMKLVGIFSKNRYEWLVADMACMLYGLTIVPLYDTLGIQNLTYCLQHSGITTLFVTQATIKTILNLKGHGNLQNLISFDPLTPQIENDLKKHSFKVFHFEDALKYDKFTDHKNTTVTEKNCLTFSYTSGTTGPPKGAMISHGNFIAFLAAIKTHQIAGFRQDDSYVSFLPLPHIMQRAVIMAMIDRGCFVAFYSGDILKFKDDVAFIKPTILVAVPRLYNRVVQNVQKKFSESTGIKGCLVNKGVTSKMQSLHSNGQFDSWFYDSIVFSKVKENFGGRIRLMVTGSAPIKKETFQFMKIIMSCPFYEGYGQTENTALAFATNSQDPMGGHVGGIASCLQFKLNDIEEMHYTSQDKDQQGRPTPRGEIWLRGAAVFLGYYKDQQKTRQAITPDGWLRTGDVGMLLPGSNAMKIIDRRKNIFKLQQGEYVAAEKVEGIYTRSHLVSEVFLHGDSHQNFAVAIVIPNKEQLLKVAQKHSINLGFEELCKDPKIRGIVIKQLDSVGKQGGLMSFEQAKNIRMDSEPFSNRGVVSSTMKLQRFAAKVYYAKQIEQMYKEGVLNLK